MCRSKYHNNKNSWHSTNPEKALNSFYNHLFVYLLLIGFILYNSPSNDSWKFVAIFGGLSLLSRYKRYKRASGRSQVSCAKVQNEEYVDDIVPPPPTPNWKDRDLV